MGISIIARPAIAFAQTHASVEAIDPVVKDASGFIGAIMDKLVTLRGPRPAAAPARPSSDK